MSSIACALGRPLSIVVICTVVWKKESQEKVARVMTTLGASPRLGADAAGSPDRSSQQTSIERRRNYFLAA